MQNQEFVHILGIVSLYVGINAFLLSQIHKWQGKRAKYKLMKERELNFAQKREIGSKKNERKRRGNSKEIETSEEKVFKKTSSRL